MNEYSNLLTKVIYEIRPEGIPEEEEIILLSLEEKQKLLRDQKLIISTFRERTQEHITSMKQKISEANLMPPINHTVPPSPVFQHIKVQKPNAKVTRQNPPVNYGSIQTNNKQIPISKPIFHRRTKSYGPTNINFKLSFSDFQIKKLEAEIHEMEVRYMNLYQSKL